MKSPGTPVSWHLGRAAQVPHLRQVVTLQAALPRQADD
ncbi:hypothetical protein BSU04_42135 [Caballeronia sordidicola]|uniref:Uncharacterized protein n=1 Tax=Caballeronia sordidicola TaxID=196367 RepID=A0A226WM13_CABSO|nr:hypothetical protein BSU04_42135 [Caballeronia sordidicola]